MDKKKVAEALRSLPQCQRIDPNDAQRWINAVAEQEPDRLLWRINRLSSFGGSDMGTLLLEAMGKEPPFSSGADLINERLMRALPDAPLYHMKKGIHLEDVVIEACLKLYGGEIDQQALDAFSLNNENLPFGLNGNIDFPWLTKQGQRALIDVKCPMAGTLTETNNTPEKKFLYGVQLNTYQLLAESKGIAPFDRIINCHLELPPVLTDAYYRRLASGDAEEKNRIVDEMVNLLKHSSPGLRLNFQEHEINPDLTIQGQTKPMFDAIREVAALNFQSVIDGAVPEPTVTANSHFDDEELAVIKAKEEELFKREAFAAKNEQSIGRLKSELIDLAKRNNTSENLSQSGNYNIKTSATINSDAVEKFASRYQLNLDDLRCDRDEAKKEYDAEAILVAAKRAGVDTEEHLKSTPFDMSKVQRAISDAGVAPETVFNAKVRVARSTKKVTRAAMESAMAFCETKIEQSINELTLADSEKNSADITSENARSGAKITR